MSEARRLLGQVMRAFGQDGGLVLFKDPEDPFGLDKGPRPPLVRAACPHHPFGSRRTHA